jgi:hypothetical protein
VAYQSHPDLRTPPDRTILWRYVDFAKFVDLLETSSLWFTRLDQLSDPLEGFYTDAELQRIRRHLEDDQAEKLINIFRDSRRGLYVNCWRSGRHESIAMWELCGKGNGIVAIKSTLGRLKRSIAKCATPIWIAKLTYIDWNEAPGLDNVLVAGSRKDSSYEHEAEVRAIVMDHTVKGIDTKGPGKRIPVDLETLVAEVVLGPREEEWVLELVEKIVERYGLSVPVFASNRLTPRP